MDNWHERFKAMKKDLGYTNKDIADITGLNVSSVNNQTQPNAHCPNWLKLSITIHERSNIEDHLKQLIKDIQISEIKKENQL